VRDHAGDLVNFTALRTVGSLTGDGGGVVVRAVCARGGGEPLHIDPPPLCGPDRANKFIIVLLLRINYIKFVCSHVLCYLFAWIMCGSAEGISNFKGLRRRDDHAF
jgi:hypothetical protein